MSDALREVFRPQAYREIDESRWYLIGVINELYTARRKTTLSNVRNTVLKRIEKRSLWSRKFFLGYNTTIEDIVTGMCENGVLETLPNGNGHKSYKLTQSGVSALRHFKVQMRIFL